MGTTTVLWYGRRIDVFISPAAVFKKMIKYRIDVAAPLVSVFGVWHNNDMIKKEIKNTIFWEETL